MQGGIRTRLKSILPERLWPILRTIDEGLIYCFYVGCWLNRRLRYPVIPYRAAERKVAERPLFSCRYSLEVKNPADLSLKLSEVGVATLEGRHSVYIGNHDDISHVFPGLTECFPAGIGLKIIRSRELARDGTPYYTSRLVAPASTWFSMRAVGSIWEKMVVSNMLADHDVAPRVYGIVRLQFTDCCYYALVVEHIRGKVLTGAAAETFITRFWQVLHELKIDTISIKDHRDLRPPAYNHNVVGVQGQACYVDIQNFTFSSARGIARLLPVADALWTHLADDSLIFPRESQGDIKQPGCISGGGACLGLITANPMRDIMPVLNGTDSHCRIVVTAECDEREICNSLYLMGYSNFSLVHYNNLIEKSGSADFSSYFSCCTYLVVDADSYRLLPGNGKEEGKGPENTLHYDASVPLYNKDDIEYARIFTIKHHS